MKVKDTLYSVSSFDCLLAFGRRPLYNQRIDSSALFGLELRNGMFPEKSKLVLTIKSLRNKSTGDTILMNKVIIVGFKDGAKPKFDSQCGIIFNNSSSVTETYFRKGVPIQSIRTVKLYREEQYEDKIFPIKAVIAR